MQISSRAVAWTLGILAVVVVVIPLLGMIGMMGMGGDDDGRHEGDARRRPRVAVADGGHRDRARDRCAARNNEDVDEWRREPVGT